MFKKVKIKTEFTTDNITIFGVYYNIFLENVCWSQDQHTASIHT